MNELLDVALTFIAAMMILSLAAQSLQEAIKIFWVVKGRAMAEGVNALVIEAAKTKGLCDDDGKQIVAEVMTRLRNLGQDGVLKNSVRLDRLDAAQLKAMILNVNLDNVTALKGIKGAAETYLQPIAAFAEQWYGWAMDPVTERYKRRMRAWSLVTGAIVVLTLNADAIALLKQARSDPVYRAQVQAAAQRLDTLVDRSDRLERSLAAATTPSTGTPGTASPAGAVTSDTAKTRALRDSVRLARHMVDSLASDMARGDIVLGKLGGHRPKDPMWWAGILISILLVSLGAPFWHDAFETLLGFKNKVRGKAELVERVTQALPPPTAPPPAAPTGTPGAPPPPSGSATSTTPASPGGSGHP